MALPSLAVVSDLVDWLGEPITDEADSARAEVMLRFASALVRRESGRTWADDDDHLVDLPDDVLMVTLACAARGYTNPEGFIDESVDDWRGARKVDESGLYLTASEKDLLSAFNGAQFGGLSTVSTTRGDYPRCYDEDERLLPPWY